MKKKLILAASLAAACVFALSACSVKVETPLSANWQRTTDYDPSYYERLEYSVAYAGEAATNTLSIALDAANSSYTVTTEALSTYSHNGVGYHEVYHLRSELTVAATYTVEKDGQTVEIASFGGENGDPDTVVSEVWFRSLYDGAALEPIHSVRTVYSHTPTSITGEQVSLFNYTVSVSYNEACTEATVQYTDHYADLTNEERVVSDHVTKSSLTSAEERTYGSLQKDYSCFDASQLTFAARGIAFSEESSNTVTVMSEAGKQQVTMTCSELTSRLRSFSLDGQEADNSSFSAAKVDFIASGNDPYKGPTRTVYYAQKTDGAENRLYNLPVTIEEPVFLSLGTYTYTLQSAVHTR